MLHYTTTKNSRFKKDLNLQIHLHNAFFSDNRFLDSYHKSFLNQTTLDSKKEKWSFLNQEFTVLKNICKKVPNICCKTLKIVKKKREKCDNYTQVQCIG